MSIYSELQKAGIPPAVANAYLDGFQMGALSSPSDFASSIANFRDHGVLDADEAAACIIYQLRCIAEDEVEATPEVEAIYKAQDDYLSGREYDDLSKSEREEYDAITSQLNELIDRLTKEALKRHAQAHSEYQEALESSDRCPKLFRAFTTSGSNKLAQRGRGTAHMARLGGTAPKSDDDSLPAATSNAA